MIKRYGIIALVCAVTALVFYCFGVVTGRHLENQELSDFVHSLPNIKPGCII